MFVITADQVDSRHQPDLAPATMAELESLVSGSLLFPIDRTAGDEIQIVLDDAEALLIALLHLTRSGRWSVGCGVGSIDSPRPEYAREGSGSAFVYARAAVDAAKKREFRFAARGERPAVQDCEALIDLLLQIRARRSPEGWQIFDLLAVGATQADAARQLGITPQAASKRTRAAAVRVELAAMSALGRMLASTGNEIDGERKRAEA